MHRKMTYRKQFMELKKERDAINVEAFQCKSKSRLKFFGAGQHLDLMKKVKNCFKRQTWNGQNFISTRKIILNLI